MNNRRYLVYCDMQYYPYAEFFETLEEATEAALDWVGEAGVTYTVAEVVGDFMGEEDATS